MNKEIHSFNISRGQFIKRCASLAAMTGLPLWYIERQELEAQQTPKKLGPNDRPSIALVGAGSQGQGDALNARNYGDIVAVCDVDRTHAEQAAKKLATDGRDPKIYSDFRRLLERSDIDIIVNATPDHWHSLVNIAAAKAGKDIYGEKPLTLTVDEGRHVIKAVRENKRILQTGTQQRSTARFRLACELVRNGRIGKLLNANVWLPAGLRDGPFKSVPVPEGLNWDFWQGQAPWADYMPQRCDRTFRFWYDYSGGTMTDWGAHHNDIAYWAIGLLAPSVVESKVSAQPIPGGYTTFTDYEVNYTYSNGIGLRIRTTRDDSIYGSHINKAGQPNGIRFEGTKGWIWVSRDEITASEKHLLTDPLPENAERLYKSNNHMGNFMDCVRSRKLPICDVEIGHRSATMCHLGAISMRTGLKLNWDAQTERFIGEHAEHANTYLKREMRKPYDYSFVS